MFFYYLYYTIKKSRRVEQGTFGELYVSQSLVPHVQELEW